MTVASDCVACGYQPYQAPDRAGFRGSRESSQAGASFELTLSTADGDRVKLSASATHSTESFDYAAVVKSARTRPAVAAVSGASSESAVSVNISVEGHLDQGEIADIRKLMSLLAKSVRQLERGHAKQALRTVAKSSGLDSITQFRFDFQKQLDFARRAYQQMTTSEPAD